MNKSILCLALAFALTGEMAMSAQVTTDKDAIVMNQNQSQTNQITMFSNLDLTPEQEQLLSTIDNPFAEDFSAYSSEEGRKAAAVGESSDRCGGDTRFQSADPLLDMVLQHRHQQLVDARVEYLQTLSEVLTPEQYNRFIKNLDSMGRME